MYFFLQKDFDALETLIEEDQRKRSEYGKEIGESCRQSSETFHDNFGFEESSRQFSMIESRLLGLRRLRNAAQIFHPEQNDCIQIGSTVTIKDEDEETLTLTIGSYIVYTDPNAISYKSPIAKILLGAKKGEVRAGTIHGKNKTFVVIGVEQFTS